MSGKPERSPPSEAGDCCTARGNPDGLPMTRLERTTRTSVCGWVGSRQKTPGRQREFNLHVSGAKQASTRERRVDKIVPRIFEGKGLRDRLLRVTGYWPTAVRSLPACGRVGNRQRLGRPPRNVATARSRAGLGNASCMSSLRACRIGVATEHRSVRWGVDRDERVVVAVEAGDPQVAVARLPFHPGVPGDGFHAIGGSVGCNS